MRDNIVPAVSCYSYPGRGRFTRAVINLDVVLFALGILVFFCVGIRWNRIWRRMHIREYVSNMQNIKYHQVCEFSLL